MYPILDTRVGVYKISKKIGYALKILLFELEERVDMT